MRTVKKRWWLGGLCAVALLWATEISAEEALAPTEADAEPIEATDASETAESLDEVEDGGVTDEGSDENPFSHDPFGDHDIDNVPPAERASIAVDLTLRGRIAFDEHNLEEAARMLDRAYRLGGDAHVLYYLALALHGLGHYDAAEERLRRYMAEVNLDPGQRYTLQLQLQGWRRQFSRVRIVTDPLGALLLLGGQPVGTSPLTEALVLPNGEYGLEARLEGYHSWNDTLLVPGGDPIELNIQLQALGDERPRRGLAIGLWTTVGLTAATAIAAVVVGVLAMGRRNEFSDNRGATEEDWLVVDRLRRGSIALTGVSATLGAAVIPLGVFYGRSR